MFLVPPACQTNPQLSTQEAAKIYKVPRNTLADRERDLGFNALSFDLLALSSAEFFDNLIIFIFLLFFVVSVRVLASWLNPAKKVHIEEDSGWELKIEKEHYNHAVVT